MPRSPHDSPSLSTRRRSAPVAVQGREAPCPVRQVRGVVAACSVLVGMHSDQATEPIVRLNRRDG